MTTREINALLALRGMKLSIIAKAIEEDPNALSQTVNYLRENKRIRRKFAAHLGMPEDELFDPMPARETAAAH